MSTTLETEDASECRPADEDVERLHGVTNSVHSYGLAKGTARMSSTSLRRVERKDVNRAVNAF